MKISLNHLIARLKNILQPSKSRSDKDLVGILIVNGGENPSEGKWLSLSLRKITEHTKWPNYKIYIWNNDPQDEPVSKLVKETPHAVLFNARSDDKMEHVHAVPLQKLYEKARKDRAKYIVTFDTDAFPLKDGWIRYLVQQLDEATVIAGVWRDELETIEPYVHPSCLCTSVDFLEKYNIRFDSVDTVTDKNVDTLSHFSDIAVRNGKNLFKLCRSNKNQLHHYMGGVYDDWIYHQGAGSRKGVFFWGEERTDEVFQRNSRIRRALNVLVFRYQKQFIDWQMGRVQIYDTPKKRGECAVVLGMDGSGMESLAEILECCGLFLCDGEKSFGISHIEPLSEIPEKIQIVAHYQHPLTAARSLKRTREYSTERGLELWADYYDRMIRLHRKFKFPLLKFDLTEPGQYVDSLAQFAVQLGLNPDLKELSDIVSRQPVLEGKTEPIPDSCLVLYEYLEENSYKMDSDLFSFHILNLKKDLF
jgi:hypothetical protein